jgi:shikimate kinase
MKIFLTGYRAAGKSTVGQILASSLGYAFSDLDREIERETKSTIQALVELHGWSYFRQMEQKALFSTQSREHMVVSTGGGIILNSANIDFILANGFSVWLQADIDTILSRLNSDPETLSSRPVLTDKNLIEETKEMIAMRTPLYEKAAHLSIDTAGHSPEEIALIIERSLA